MQTQSKFENISNRTKDKHQGELSNHIGGVMVSVPATSDVDRGFESLSGQTKDYKNWVQGRFALCRFVLVNRYYIIIDEVFFDNFWVIIYLLVVYKKNNNIKIKSK